MAGPSTHPTLAGRIAWRVFGGLSCLLMRGGCSMQRFLHRWFPTPLTLAVNPLFADPIELPRFIRERPKGRIQLWFRRRVFGPHLDDEYSVADISPAPNGEAA